MLILAFHTDICVVNGFKAALFFLTLMSFASCNRDKCITASGPRTAKDSLIGDVNSLFLRMVADLTVKVDTSQNPHLETTAQEVVHPRIAATTFNGEMQISLSRCIKQHDEILMEAVLNDLHTIKMSSAGSLVSSLLVKKDSLHFVNSGLGDIDFLVDSKKIVAEIEGGGDIYLGGKTDHLEFLSISSGDLHAFNLIADTLDLYLNGSSVIEIYSNGIVNLHFIQPTKVHYRGNPTINAFGEGEWIDSNL